MDKKQFDLFQTSVQWVWDDNQRKESGRPHGGALHHEQGLWVGGRIIEKIKAKWGGHQRTMQLVCPTACCLGGNIVIANGDQMVTEEEWDTGDFTTAVEYCLDEKNQVHTIQVRAQELIGIEGDEASQLFEGGNTAEDIVEIGAKVARKYGYELEVM